MNITKINDLNLLLYVYYVSLYEAYALDIMKRIRYEVLKRVHECLIHISAWDTLNECAYI